MTGIDVNRGAKRAREARVALDLDEAAPLDCLLQVVEERARLAVIVTALPPGLAGACYREGAEAVLWVNGTHITRRQRFTLAHELGHAWCRHDGRLEPDTVETVSGRTTNPFERQANAFAAEFLVPRAGLQWRVDADPTLDDVVRIAAEYGVSAPVVLYRLKLLRLTSRERIARLEHEVGSGEHLQLSNYLGLESLEDRLEQIARLPYLSPSLSGTLLEAALRGDAAVGRDVAVAIDRLLS